MQARLQLLSAPRVALADHEGLAPAVQLDRARERAEPIRGARVLLISALPLDPGDCSASLAPLLSDLGLDASRAVLHGDRDFHRVAHELDAALHGGRWTCSDSDVDGIAEACETAAVGFDLRGYDAILVQGVGAARLIEGRRSSGSWLWRTGSDASAPDPVLGDWLNDALRAYYGLVFAMPGFAPARLATDRTGYIPGAFDPLAPGQEEPAPGGLAAALAPFGIDLSRPLVCQTGALDSWADPPGVIEAWRLARDEVPGLQLVIAGRVDPADPEAADVLQEIDAFASSDHDLHLLTDRSGASAAVRGAAARVARCAVSAVLADRFDPAVAASLWRGDSGDRRGPGRGGADRGRGRRLPRRRRRAARRADRRAGGQPAQGRCDGEGRPQAGAGGLRDRPRARRRAGANRLAARWRHRRRGRTGGGHRLMEVKLPDGSALDLADGASGADAAAAIGPGLAKAALAVEVGGELRDLSAPLAEGDELRIITDRDPEALPLIRHDAAHVMAEAVLELWPQAKISIGPAIEDGFYYDIEFPEEVSVSDADLERIEEVMRAHIAADEPFERRELPVTEAIEHFGSEEQSYKVELIEDLRDDGEETVSLYRNGPFEDLCLGPHGPSTGRIKAVKLNSVAGAYWRGDETRQMLTRIYGTAFFSKKDLDAHLERIEQAKARDHRRLGQELGLFLLREEAPGMPFWLPNGTVLLRLIQREVDEQLRKRGYREIKTPNVLDEELWHRSGHWENYRENMFFAEPSEREGDERRFALKPMNCPGACLVFDSERHSYRELPLRLAEYGTVSRFEREGVLHGLMRVRAFTQDDAHVYCTLDQVPDEVDSICEAIDELYSRFGFEQVRVELSTRPEKSVGTDEQWERAEAGLREALERQGRPFEVNPGDGTFYGPKIDFHITDALGRSWQCGTCQLDFQMPERFDLSYTGADDEQHRPVMIHRALLGSMERFAGILIEHHAGRFPAWLAPVQAVVLPVADRHVELAGEVAAELRERRVRVEVDERSESVGKKIRAAELARYPYMLVLGDRELEARAVSVRSHDDGELGQMSVEDFAARIAENPG